MKVCFVSCPKRFEGATAITQRRAIESWQNIALTSDLCLVAPEEDFESIPSDLKRYARVAKKNTYSGMPLFADIINQAYRDSDAELFCYLNADIILPDNFGQVPAELLSAQFLICGARWDLAQGAAVPGASTSRAIQSYIREGLPRGDVSLHSVTGIDYFLFRRGTLDGLKPLIVGRGGYDAALLAYCMRFAIRLVDATETYFILHQNHDYSHVLGAREEVMLGREAQFNRTQHDIVHGSPVVSDASYVLRRNTLYYKPLRCGLFRRLELFVRFRLRLKYISYMFRFLCRLFPTKRTDIDQTLSILKSADG